MKSNCAWYLSNTYIHYSDEKSMLVTSDKMKIETAGQKNLILYLMQTKMIRIDEKKTFNMGQYKSYTSMAH